MWCYSQWNRAKAPRRLSPLQILPLPIVANIELSDFRKQVPTITPLTAIKRDKLSLNEHLLLALQKPTQLSFEKVDYYGIMRKNYERFVLLVTLALATIWSTKLLLHTALAITRSKEQLFTDATDPESALAMGLRLPLKCTDPWGLELIPKISTKLAKRLFMEREHIIAKARETSEREALLEVYGVGESTAKRLLSYISLHGRCDNTPQYRELKN
jgi:hypothetical protein